MLHHKSYDVKPNFSINVTLHCLTKCEDICDEFTPQDLHIPNDLKSHQEYYDVITLTHIRSAVKRNHRIPEVCQTQILLNEGYILDDTAPLSTFHFKPSDRLEVLYYAAAKVDIIDEILGDIESLLGTCQRFSSCDDRDVRQDLLHVISDKESFLRSLTFIVFLPWNSPETEAGKLYFVSKGGMEKLMKLLEWTIEMGHLDPTLETIVEFEKDLFLALWGFADTLQEKLLLLESDCLQLAMRVLTDNMGHKILVHHALGLTQMLMEIPDAQKIMVNNPKSIFNIAECLKSRVEASQTANDRFPEATILCRLSHSVESHKILTDEKIFDILFSVLRDMTERGHFFLKYLLLQFFMNIMVNPRIPAFQPNQLETMKHLMTSFLTKHSWEQLYQYETKNGYNCSTIVPFIHALFLPKQCQVYNAEELMQAYLQVTMMSLKNVLYQPNKQQLFVQQHLEDFLLIASWQLPQACKNQLIEIMKFFKPKVPSLQNIAISRLGIEQDGFSPIFATFKT